MTEFWMALAMTMAAFAEVSATNTGSIALTIQVFDEVGMGKSSLRTVENEVTRIFARAGIEIAWISCPVPEAGQFGKRVCKEPDDPRLFVLWIRDEDTRVGPKSKTALGFAMPLAPRANHLAAIYPRVQELARRTNEIGVDKVLAGVIAHELGHLLFRNNSHGEGIMRPLWSDRELKEMHQGRLAFTPSQSARLRLGLTSRTPENLATTGN